MGSPILAPERQESHHDSPGALCRGSGTRCVGLRISFHGNFRLSIIGQVFTAF
jgi:hypothetical protein